MLELNLHDIIEYHKNTNKLNYFYHNPVAQLLMNLIQYQLILIQHLLHLNENHINCIKFLFYCEAEDFQNLHLNQMDFLDYFPGNKKKMNK